jgi:hypothetical protein
MDNSNSIPGMGMKFYILHSLQFVAGAHRVSYRMGTAGKAFGAHAVPYRNDIGGNAPDAYTFPYQIHTGLKQLECAPHHLLCLVPRLRILEAVPLHEFMMW